MTVSLLTGGLRQQNVRMEEITVMIHRVKNRWAYGVTVYEDIEMADKALDDLGCGQEGKTVWLAVTEEESIRDKESGNIASMRVD